MPEIACVNGKFLPLARAVVPIEDRGLQFGDSVYEVLRTYRGQPFALADHLARLRRSLAAIELAPGWSAERLTALIKEAIRRGRFAESVVYLQITRGGAPRHRRFPAHCRPTLILIVRELRVPRRRPLAGLKVITVSDNRWGRCDIKSVGLLANVLAFHAARRAHADDALFVGTDDSVREATAGNVFVVSGARLRTPPPGPHLLAGVTHAKILQVARALGIDCREERIRRWELWTADEVFLTSTTHEVVPVIAVDRHRIGNGKPGPVARQLYWEFLRRFAG